eukprot:8098129-Alexandrium_andersonii.AAC.1
MQQRLRNALRSDRVSATELPPERSCTTPRATKLRQPFITSDPQPVVLSTSSLPAAPSAPPLESLPAA